MALVAKRDDVGKDRMFVQRHANPVRRFGRLRDKFLSCRMDRKADIAR